MLDFEAFHGVFRPSYLRKLAVLGLLALLFSPVISNIETTDGTMDILLQPGINTITVEPMLAMSDNAPFIGTLLIVGCMGLADGTHHIRGWLNTGHDGGLGNLGACRDDRDGCEIAEILFFVGGGTHGAQGCSEKRAYEGLHGVAVGVIPRSEDGIERNGGCAGLDACSHTGWGGSNTCGGLRKRCLGCCMGRYRLSKRDPGDAGLAPSALELEEAVVGLIGGKLMGEELADPLLKKMNDGILWEESRVIQQFRKDIMNVIEDADPVGILKLGRIEEEGGGHVGYGGLSRRAVTKCSEVGCSLGPPAGFNF